jgi:hypothetical protein
MTVENFHLSEIKTNMRVLQFYGNVRDNNARLPPTWEEEERLRAIMKARYGKQRCRLCGKQCVVLLTKDNKNGNRGKWHVRCKAYSCGHTFDFLPDPTLPESP